MIEMKFTVDAIHENIAQWELMKSERASPLNNIQPSPDGTPARSRPGI